MAKESFLFVPYHAGRRDLADTKIANSDARSHAAAISRQRRDHQKRLKAQTDPQNTKPALSDTVDEVSNSGTNDEHSPTDEQHGQVSPSTTTELVRAKNKVERRQHMRAMQFSWRAGNVSSAFKFCNGTRVDPFGSTPDADFASAAVDYFWQAIVPANRPIYAIFNVTNTYTSYWNELLSDDVYKPAGIAMVGAIRERCVNPSNATSDDVMSNRASAIVRLQKRYREVSIQGHGSMDAVGIITALALANLARFLGDLESYEKHRRAMKDMIDARGGLDTLGHEGLAKCALMQWDSFWVFEPDGEPLFSDSRSEHIPVYPAFPLYPDLRKIFVRLPTGFQSLMLKGKLSVETIEILGRMSDAVVLGSESLAQANISHSELRKYNDFLEACPCLRASDESQNTIEKEICLALFLYCFHHLTAATSNTSLLIASRAELSRLLAKLNHQKYSLPEQECLYWICVVCIESWCRNGSIGDLLPKGRSLLPRLRQLRSAVAGDHTLQKFFYDQKLLDTYESFMHMAD